MPERSLTESSALSVKAGQPPGCTAPWDTAAPPSTRKQPRSRR